MRGLILAALLLAGCAPAGYLRVVTFPQIIEVKPSETYLMWWRQMQECSKGVEPTWPVHRFDEVRYFVVQSDSTLGYLLEDEKGYTLASGNINPHRHHLYFEQRFMFARRIVGHEMLHALGFEHDETLFRKCGVAY